MSALSYLLLFVSYHALSHALYEESSIIIDVDITIDSISTLSLEANSPNLANTVQSAFRHTNEDPLYYITSIHSIESISNISYFDHDDTFRFHAIFSVYFTSKSQYEMVLDQYRSEIFHGESSRRSFIKLFESNLEDELSSEFSSISNSGNSNSNDHSHSSSTISVDINTMGIFEGNLIMNYHSMYSQTTSTERPSIISTKSLTAGTIQKEQEEEQDAASADSTDFNIHSTRSFVEDNLSLILVIGGSMILLCLCALMCCFCTSSSHRVSRKQLLQRRRWMDAAKTRVSGQSGQSTPSDCRLSVDEEGGVYSNCSPRSLRSHYNNRRNDFSRVSGPDDADDPFSWNHQEVASWLESQELDDFVEMIGGAKMNGRDLLTMRLSIDTQYEEEVFSLVQNIKHLRLISEGYSRWKTRNEVTSTEYDPYEVDERKGLKSEASDHSYSRSADHGEDRMDGVNGIGSNHGMNGDQENEIDIDVDGTERTKREPLRNHLDIPSGHQYKESASLTVDGSMVSVSAAGTIIIHDTDIETAETQDSVPPMGVCFQSPPPVVIDEESTSTTGIERLEQRMSGIFNVAGIMGARSPLSESHQIYE